MTTLTFSIKYNHGDAANGKLDMYDAAISFQGFARALSITAHALLNDGEIRKRAHRIEGGELFICPSRKGSFEQIVSFVVTNQEAIGASIVAATFYDLVKWTWSKTLEAAYEPQTPHVRKLAQKIEPFIGEMEEALELPLELAHRPIRQNQDVVITINRQRSGEVIRLDNETLSAVSLQTESNITDNIIGNVTKYNLISGYGRFYDDQLEHTISFKLEDTVSSAQKQLITWSLHHAQNQEGQGKIIFEAKRVLTSRGIVKRYLVTKITQA